MKIASSSYVNQFEEKIVLGQRRLHHIDFTFSKIFEVFKLICKFFTANRTQNVYL